MTKGGRREGAGRKRQGITKKVSLTLSEELWHEIEIFDGTVADYIRFLKASLVKFTDKEMIEVTLINGHQKDKELNEVTSFKKQNPELTKRSVEEYWSIYKEDFLWEQSDEQRVSEEAINNAYQSLMRDLFNGEETVQLETSPRYRSSFSGKWFSSIKNLLKAEVPMLITNAETAIKRKKENAERNKKND